MCDQSNAGPGVFLRRMIVRKLTKHLGKLISGKKKEKKRKLRVEGRHKSSGQADAIQ